MTRKISIIIWKCRLVKFTFDFGSFDKNRVNSASKDWLGPVLIELMSVEELNKKGINCLSNFRLYFHPTKKAGITEQIIEKPAAQIKNLNLRLKIKYGTKTNGIYLINTDSPKKDAAIRSLLRNKK